MQWQTWGIGKGCAPGSVVPPIGQQAERLWAAYAVLGPMLEAYKSGDEAAFSEPYCSAVRDFRYKVPEDLQALRAEAIRQAGTGRAPTGRRRTGRAPGR